jgi:hypothetical protein
LISIPTTKKKSVMSPSFTSCATVNRAAASPIASVTAASKTSR